MVLTNGSFSHSGIQSLNEFPDYLMQPHQVPEYVFYKFKLVPCPHQIVLGIARREIDVAVKVVGEESYAALVSHDRRGFGQQTDLFLREEILGAADVAFAVAAEVFFEKMNF